MRQHGTPTLHAVILMLAALILVPVSVQARQDSNTRHTARMARGELIIDLGPKVLANRRKTKAVRKLALLSMMSDYTSLRLDELKLRDSMSVHVTVLTMRIGGNLLYARSHLTVSVRVNEGDRLLGQFDTHESTGLGKHKATVAKWLSRGISIRIAKGVQEILADRKDTSEPNGLRAGLGGKPS